MDSSDDFLPDSLQSSNQAIYSPESHPYLSAGLRVTGDNAQELAALRLDAELAREVTEWGGRPVSLHSADPQLGEAWVADTQLRDLAVRPDHPARVRRQRAWMANSTTWPDSFGPGWAPHKFLGQGGFGMVGAWKFNGVDGDHDDPDHQWERHIRYIVIKQARVMGGLGLRHEAAIQKWLLSTGSKHFPAIYRGPVRSAGAGTQNLRLDSSRREVHRLYMEYLGKGDMFNALSQRLLAMPADSINIRWVSELEMWSNFDCLVRAAMVMDHGDEISQQPQHGLNPDQPIVHFDYKLENVLVGEYEQPEHSRVPILKTTDFGLATRALPSHEQNPHYIYALRRRGTLGWLTPEQQRMGTWAYYNGLIPFPNNQDAFDTSVEAATQDRKYGSHTNIYGIGEIMYCLATWRYNLDDVGPLYYSNLSPRLSVNATRGMSLEQGIVHPRHPETPDLQPDLTVSGAYGVAVPPPLFPLPYSDELKACILECLIERWNRRIPLAELRRRVRNGLQNARAATPRDADSIARDNSPHTAPPDIPQRWIAQHDPRALRDVLAHDPAARYRALPEVTARIRRDRLRTKQIVEARDYLQMPLRLPSHDEFLLRRRISRYERDFENARRKADPAYNAEQAAKAQRIVDLANTIRLTFIFYEPTGTLQQPLVVVRYVGLSLPKSRTIRQVIDHLAQIGELKFILANTMLAPATSRFHHAGDVNGTTMSGTLSHVSAPLLERATIRQLRQAIGFGQGADGRWRGCLEVRQRQRRLFRNGVEVQGLMN